MKGTSMGLREYQRKRDFAATPEPAAGGKAAAQPSFVVQLHHASHRHYDFRLELDGVLKSWAIPKGPSFDPAVKRLAVAVEDHPLSYADFAGDIPAGHYGAGHVDVFDSGTWEAVGSARAGLRKGDLKFVLHGDILKGSWVLVRTRKQGSKQQWLLIKHRDRFAGSGQADDFVDKASDRPLSVVAGTNEGKADSAAAAARGRRAKPAPAKAGKTAKASAIGVAETLRNEPFEPQLCSTRSQAPDGDDWLHEAKWDGYRLLASVVRGRVRLWSRNGIEWTKKLPELVDAIASLGFRSAQLDGELVALLEGRDDFNTLQARLAGDNDAQLSYRLFDLPHVDGRSLRCVPLLERKARLKALLDAASPSPLLRYSAHQRGHGPTVFAQAVAGGLEGIVSKQVDGSYQPGRSTAWVKVKARPSDEFIVVGYTEPKGGRLGIGALLLAKPQGKGLRYVGRVGSGLDDAALRALRRKLEATALATTDVDHAAMAARDRRLARWVKPGLVVEVFHQDHGGNGLLRQASFKGLRADKAIKDLRAAPTSQAAEWGDDAMRKPPTTKLSHPERIVFPKLEVSKADVAAFYASMAPWLLPEIAGRPLSVLRCPDGVGKPCFFQKHAGKGWGEHVHSLAIPESSGRVDHLLIDDADGLAELVQMNTLELHPWGSRGDDVEHADRIVFDLDPHASVDFKAVVAAARDVRSQLQAVGLESFVRTSGGKGLHVVVPLSPPAPWKSVKAFAEAVAKTMAARHPDRYVAVAGESKRKGRIFIDWLRNGRGATSVASYSLRARDSAGVAMPLSWQALGRVGAGDAYTIRNALRHLRQRSSDPWALIATVRQSLPRSTAPLRTAEAQPARPAVRKSAAAPRGRGSAR